MGRGIKRKVENVEIDYAQSNTIGLYHEDTHKNENCWAFAYTDITFTSLHRCGFNQINTLEVLSRRLLVQVILFLNNLIINSAIYSRSYLQHSHDKLLMKLESAPIFLAISSCPTL